MSQNFFGCCSFLCSYLIMLLSSQRIPSCFLVFHHVSVFVFTGPAGAAGGQRAGVCPAEERAEGAEEHRLPQTAADTRSHIISHHLHTVQNLSRIWALAVNLIKSN